MPTCLYRLWAAPAEARRSEGAERGTRTMNRAGGTYGFEQSSEKLQGITKHVFSCFAFCSWKRRAWENYLALWLNNDKRVYGAEPLQEKSVGGINRTQRPTPRGDSGCDQWGLRYTLRSSSRGRKTEPDRQTDKEGQGEITGNKRIGKRDEKRMSPSWE